MKLFSFTLFGLIIFCSACNSNKQNVKEDVTNDLHVEKPNLRFEEEIKQFELMDQRARYASNAIVFTGSSSIRLWTTLAEDMNNLPVINRGFGGATNPEVIYYADRYLYKHQPKFVVYYCGENDIAEGSLPQQVLASFKKFVSNLESKLPKTQLVYLSMKPSPARWSLWPKYKEADTMIKSFVDSKTNLHYFDTSITMLDDNGEVRKDIFIADMLHMNTLGYEGWTSRLYPMLSKLYQDN
ncbi:MAG: hypothetical protein HKO66_13235 [Saprospiraceae bacterium]|nr:hypothetical protein [Bacteroidia bacterium]NNL93197.1 hypothetical protein [Saprospiraceae bacterium]